MNKDTQIVKELIFETTDGSFDRQSLQEKLIFYSGSMTHSCVYLFNPIADTANNEETSFKFDNVTYLNTHEF